MTMGVIAGEPCEFLAGIRFRAEIMREICHVRTSLQNDRSRYSSAMIDLKRLVCQSRMIEERG